MLERFVPALANRDFRGLETCFHDKARFRALIPPGLREALGPAEAVAHLRRWFGNADVIEIITSEVEDLGRRSSVAYRLRVRENSDWFVVEQRAFCTLEDGKIAAMDLLCSGFMREGE